jgi:hypothetical protein
MANNSTEFSFQIKLDSQDEVRWFENQLEEVPVNEDGTSAHADAGDHVPRYLDGTDYADPASYFGLGVVWRFDRSEQIEGQFLAGCYSEESGDPELVAVLLWKYLQAFHPDRYIAFEYACTCSKPRPDEFSGGAYFVTAETIASQTTFDWIFEKQAAFQKSKGHPVSAEGQ